MKYNVGKCDRRLRILIGLLIVGAGFYFKSWWGAVGLISIFTGLISWCTNSGPLGKNTCTANVNLVDDDPGVYDDAQGDE